jgi:pyruvate/2-oxoglutarate dehydrogenase complex dihydrolipoamide dehydrogenase (E3) component
MSTAVTGMTTPISIDEACQQEWLSHVRPAGWRQPEPAGIYQLIVIGAGPAGLAAAHAAAAQGLRTALIERDMLGGDSLNAGSISSKSLLRTARAYADIRRADHYGASVPEAVPVDFAKALTRMHCLRARISRTSSAQELRSAGIDLYFGQASFAGSDTIHVDGVRLQFEKAIIATGAEPDAPAIPGLEEAGYLTNESVFGMTELPKRLLVIGGGPLGCELAQAFSSFGARTIIVQDMPLFLPREERDAAQILSDAFARDGIEVRLNTAVVAVRCSNGEKLVDMVSDDYHSTVATDVIIAGTGRMPRVSGLDLDTGGIAFDAINGIHVDDFLCTSNPRVHAAGDVCLEYRFAHVAVASARIAVANALEGAARRMSELVIPWCTYTDPEIAHVGLYVRQAHALDIPVRTFTVPLHVVDRAVLDGQDTGFVKINVAQASDRILGATIVARGAGDMLNEISVAMQAGLGMLGLAEVIHCYPTQGDAIRIAARACMREMEASTASSTPS